jgi:hypothetical protein
MEGGEQLEDGCSSCQLTYAHVNIIEKREANVNREKIS